MSAVARTPEDQASRLRLLVEQFERPQARTPSPARRFGVPVVAIASGKGGVGKTMLAVNLSIAMARLGARTTLVDADLGMANADVLCGLLPRRRLERAIGLREDGAAVTPIGVDEIAVDAPGGFRLVPGAVGVARMTELAHEQRRHLMSALVELERASDLIIIDTSAGMGTDVTTFLSSGDLGLIVATPEPTSITDAYALIKCMAQRGGGGRLELVVNQAERRKDAMRVYHRIAGVAQRFLGEAIPLAGWIPRDARVGEAVRKRRPLLLTSRRSAPSRAVVHLAQRLRDRLWSRVG